MASERQHLRMPGRVYERFNQLAQERMSAPRFTTRPPLVKAHDEELADALSRPKLKRRGGGYSVYVALEIPQVERLIGWVTDDHPKLLRDYADQVRKAVSLHRANTEDTTTKGTTA